MARKLGNRLRFFFVVRFFVVIALMVAGPLSANSPITAAFIQELSQKAAAAMRAGQFAEAERLYRHLVKIAPANPGWEANLGLALHSQDKYGEAVTHLEKSIRAKPNTGLSAVLGIDYLKINQPCKAIEPLQRTDKQEALADAYSGCKRYADAGRLYVKLRKPREAAHAWWQERNYAEAQPLFASIANEYRADQGFCYEYGDTLLRVESPEAAIPWLELAGNLVEARAALGKAYSALGRYSEALPHLQAAVALDPDLLLPISRAYKETGRAAEAERALKQYRERQARQN